MKKIAHYSFEQSPFGIWEDCKVQIGGLSVTLSVEDSLIDDARLAGWLGKLDAEYLNLKIVQCYPHLYKHSHDLSMYEGVYIPHFVLYVIHILGENKMDLCFKKSNLPYSYPDDGVLWSVSFENDEITEVLWTTT